MLIALLERTISHPKWGPTLKISLLITIPLAAIVTVTVAFVAAPALPWAFGGSGVALGGGVLARKYTKNRGQTGAGEVVVRRPTTLLDHN